MCPFFNGMVFIQVSIDFFSEIITMSTIIYILTVFYFSYVIYVVLGDKIGVFIKHNCPNHLSGLLK
ncbi:hypothetical protein Metme_4554 [Methylomonas methanica MC09]|uniref:Uncharacterized protein n=1 Tax=Methylomonas methanica (strain DSM 25384 / MC09) TaxID=857087 RepID=G0A5N6_METMM|nr:hypothetical protein Metme_4554 [Methylomonas methanica MC09]